MIKKFNEFNKVNERLIPGQKHYQFTNREFGTELNKINSDVEEQLYKALEYCMENDVFEKEEINAGEFWYKFPSTSGLSLDWTNDAFGASEYQPAGDKVGNHTIPKGGYLFGSIDNNNEHEMNVSDLGVWGMIDLLRDVESWIDADLNGSGLE